MLHLENYGVFVRKKDKPVRRVQKPENVRSVIVTRKYTRGSEEKEEFKMLFNRRCARETLGVGNKSAFTDAMFDDNVIFCTVCVCVVSC